MGAQAFECSQCGARASRIVDSRQSSTGDGTWRRRKCFKCDHRFTTFEVDERSFQLLQRLKDGKLRAALMDTITALEEHEA